MNPVDFFIFHIGLRLAGFAATMKIVK